MKIRITLITSALVLTPVAAHAAAPTVFRGKAPSLHPEGVAFDAARNVFLVGSLRHGTVSVVNRNGTVRTLVKDPKLVATVGIRVKGNLLYVTNSDNGGSTKSSPKTNLKLAGLGIYDVRTGKRVRYVTLKADGAPHFANDVAVGPDGTAYVTDSLSATIFKVPLKGKPSVLVTDKRLGGDGFGLNGIVWAKGGLIAGKGNDGTLWRVSKRGKIAKINAPALPGADGLAVRPDGKLVVVVNGFGDVTKDFVYTLRPSRGGWAKADIAKRYKAVEPVPTTAAVDRKGKVWVLSGRIDILLTKGTTLNTFTLTRF